MKESSTMSQNELPPVRVRLVEGAARLLADEGPKALSARRLAAEVGTSTMAVYTHIGGMPELVRAVVEEGFGRLAGHLAAAPRSDDPVADLGRLAVAYRANALANPQLYAVMFGSASLGGYRLQGDELAIGTETFEVMVEATGRAMDAGRLRPGDPAAASAQLWSAIHGFVMLELAGHFNGDEDAAGVLVPLLLNLTTGLSDDPIATARSLRSALDPTA
jgi:AcrR family transcriptional regulator